MCSICIQNQHGSSLGKREHLAFHLCPLFMTSNTCQVCFVVQMIRVASKMLTPIFPHFLIVRYFSLTFDSTRVDIKNGTTQAIYLTLDDPDSNRILAGQVVSDPSASDDNVIVDFPAFYVVDPFNTGTSESDGKPVTW